MKTLSDQFEKQWPAFRGRGARHPIFAETPVYTHITQWLERAEPEVRARRSKEILDWIDENEYCAKCCSPKKYCHEWGKYASAIDTDDLKKFLAKENT